METFSDFILSGGDLTAARADTPRQRLLDAGLVIFSRDGYEAATTRDIARQAEVNLAAIPYYYGGKEGLYHVVVQSIADLIGLRFAESSCDIAALLDARPPASRKALFSAFKRILSTFGRFIIGSQAAALFAPIILREQMHPTAAFDILYAGGLGQGHRTACRLVARLMGRSEDDAEAVICTHAMLGQILAFRAAREVAMRRIGWTHYSDEHLAVIERVVLENCRRILNLRAKEIES